jgi:hypothetical protein
MPFARQQHERFVREVPSPKGSDSGIFVKASVRSGHAPEDASGRALGLVRGGKVARTGAVPKDDAHYQAEASRLLEDALTRAGATKTDLARALAKDEKWARKLLSPDEAPTLTLAGFLRLHETAPTIFAAIKRTIDILSTPAPLHAPEVSQQRRILARSFAELMAADDGPDSLRASERHHDALAGFDAAVAAKEASCR